jgi:membrane-associated phospholipid phosphatase
VGVDSTTAQLQPRAEDLVSPELRERTRSRWVGNFLFVATANILVFNILFQLYKMVRRSFIQRGERIGFDHADQIIDLEKKLHLYVEIDLQRWVLSLDSSVMTFFSYFYSFFMWIFFACCVIAIAFRPRVYPRFRRVFYLSMLLALPWYAIYPLAPPRFMTGEGFIDATAFYGPSDLTDTPLVQANQFAAMPSMHVGWTTIGALMLAMALPWYKIGWFLGTLLVATMCFTVMVTGHHWWLDFVGGWLVVAASFGIARVLPERIDIPWLPPRSSPHPAAARPRAQRAPTIPMGEGTKEGRLPSPAARERGRE